MITKPFYQIVSAAFASFYQSSNLTLFARHLIEIKKALFCVQCSCSVQCSVFSVHLILKYYKYPVTHTHSSPQSIDIFVSFKQQRLIYSVQMKHIAPWFVIFTINMKIRLAETPECWSLEFKLDATFADKCCHICRQIVDTCRQFFIMTTIKWKKWI